MPLDIAVQSDTGQVREHNEDYVGMDRDLGLIVLADGMGGYQAGEVASEVAVKTIIHELRQQMKAHPPTQEDKVGNYHRVSVFLEQAVIKANQRIFSLSEEHSQYRGMGTTVVAALFQTDFVSIAHVGDSRLYRWRDEQFEQVTKDHSVLQELIDCGFYTREQARHSPNKNLVTRALGVSDKVVVDVQEQPLQPHDVYLFCSDGLNDMLEDKLMAEILSLPSESGLEATAQLLVTAANQAGGEDNISVVLVRALPKATEQLAEHWSTRMFKWAGLGS